MGTPTRDDVWLCLHLYEQRREPELRRAREWLMKFNPASFDEIRAVIDGDAGEEANRWWRQGLSYWEMIAALMNSGGITQECRELFAQTTREWFFAWSKIAPFIDEIRAVTRPGAFRNLEMLCRSQPEYEATLEYFAKQAERLRGKRTGRVRGEAKPSRGAAAGKRR
jgi:hypothetical protein